MTRTGRSALTVMALLAGVIPVAGCVSGPVESDPVAAEQRFERMRRDCIERNGQWYPDEKACVGADRVR
jgi:hypothetical protein